MFLRKDKMGQELENKDGRQETEQQVSSGCIDRHKTKPAKPTLSLSPAVTSQLSEKPAAKRGHSSASCSRQSTNKLLFPVLVFTHFTACQTQLNVYVKPVQYRNLWGILNCSTVTKSNFSVGSIGTHPEGLFISMSEHWYRLL